MRGCGGVLGTLACARVGALRPVRGRPWRGEVRAVGSTLLNDTLVPDSIGGVLSNPPGLRSVPLSWRSASPTTGRLENPAGTLHTATHITGARTNALQYLTISICEYARTVQALAVATVRKFQTMPKRLRWRGWRLDADGRKMTPEAQEGEEIPLEERCRPHRRSEAAWCW